MKPVSVRVQRQIEFAQGSGKIIAELLRGSLYNLPRRGRLALRRECEPLAVTFRRGSAFDKSDALYARRPACDENGAQRARNVVVDQGIHDSFRRSSDLLSSPSAT